MRRRLDQYFTPEHATLALLQHVPISGVVFEPCSGTQQIARVVRSAGCTVLTNDLDPAFPAECHMDATQSSLWAWAGRVDWVVSNPPFNCCQPIILHAMAHASRGVAMFLRLSYKEPCNDRAEFLAAHPPSEIVLPRISFTGDGKTDNVTCSWFIWDFERLAKGEGFVKVMTKAEVGRLQPVSGIASSVEQIFIPCSA